MNTGCRALRQACYVCSEIDFPMVPVSHPEEKVSLFLPGSDLNEEIILY